MAGDKLLDLPPELLEKILGYLPIRSLVGMGLLSRNWVDRWIDIPQVTIEDPNRKDFHSLLKLGYHALHLHRGKITEFSLDCGPHSWEDIGYDVDHWIYFLSRNVERISLRFATPCDIAASKFSYGCPRLQFLQLRNCSLAMAEHCTGFANLSHLDMGLCEGQGLDTMINRAPNLKTVVLYKIDFNILEISSKSITNFSFEGSFREFSMRDCPNLVGACIKLSGSQEKLDGDIRAQPFTWLCSLERLTANGFFLKFLEPHVRTDELYLLKMEYLHLFDIDLFDPDVMTFVFNLIRRCLNLKKLIMKGSGKPDAGGGHLTKAKEYKNGDFPKLKSVKIEMSLESLYPKDEGWNKTSIEIIKMIIAGSPILEEFVIYHDARCWRDEIWLFRELSSVERASTQLQLSSK